MDDEIQEIMGLSDTITLIGELEHLRRHELNAYYALLIKAENADDDNEHNEIIAEAQDRMVNATHCQLVRRDIMGELDIDETDWCSVKAAACVKQLAYENREAIGTTSERAVRLANDVLGQVFGTDLSGCASCREDMDERTNA